MSQQSTGGRGLGTAHPVPYTPQPSKKEEPVDTAPCEYQPLGVDDEEPSY